MLGVWFCSWLDTTIYPYHWRISSFYSPHEYLPLKWPRKRGKTLPRGGNQTLKAGFCLALLSIGCFIRGEGFEPPGFDTTLEPPGFRTTGPCQLPRKVTDFFRKRGNFRKTSSPEHILENLEPSFVKDASSRNDPFVKGWFYNQSIRKWENPSS